MPRSEPGPLFFYILLALAAVLLVSVTWPIASALFLAAVIAGVLFPFQERLTKAFRRRGIAAGILVLSVVLVILGPLVALSAVAVSEVTEGVRYVKESLKSEGVTGLIRKLPPTLQGLTTSALKNLSTDPNASVDKTVNDQLSGKSGTAASFVSAVAMATGSLLFQSAMMLIGLYFLLVDGPRLIKWLDGVVPLRRGELLELLSEFRKVSQAVIVSSTITAGVQAGVALIGYYIARVPNPLFFGGLTFVIGLIPAIGAGAVCLIAAALLYVTGHPYMALFLAIWGIVVVGLIDNVVKPYLASDGMEMHGAIVFFALIGGLTAFGAVGLLIGPLVASLFITLIKMYKRDYRKSTG